MWESKQTKQSINLEAFRTETLKNTKLLILPCIAAIILILVFTAFLKSLLGYLMHAFDDPTSEGYLDPQYIAELFFILAVLLVAIGFPFFLIIRNLVFYVRITGRHYSIVEDTLVRKVDREFTRVWGRVRYDDVFYFEKYGRYTVPRTERSAFDYSSENEMFYLIVLNGRRPRIMRAYNTKVYDYNN